MSYDFDLRTDRRGTNDLKWSQEHMRSYGFAAANDDTIPMWLADTDFPCAPVILDALKARLDKRIFGYCSPTKEFFQAISYWMETRFDWKIDPAWILPLPGVVEGINIAVRAFTRPGDGVIVQTPVYNPFFETIQALGRTVKNSPLLCKDGRYEMDFDHLEKLAMEENTKLFILCSPHNPVGRVWTAEELTRLSRICLKHGVRVVVDEIHSDIVYTGFQHHPLLSLDEKAAECFIHLGSPGKTFNVPGLKVGYAIIPNKEVRDAFQTVRLEMHLKSVNTFGIEALTAAYSREGAEWADEEVAYLEKNRDFVREFLDENLSGKIQMTPMEGTFLGWLDCSGSGLSYDEVIKRIRQDANIFCIPGVRYGEGGEMRIRLNLGSQKALLREALERIRSVF